MSNGWRVGFFDKSKPKGQYLFETDTVLFSKLNFSKTLEMQQSREMIINVLLRLSNNDYY